MKRFFSFPNPVNDAAARTVAIGVVTMALVALVTNTAWLLIPLTYGFVARVAAGPKISPLGQFAVRIAARDSRGSKSPFPDHRSASPKRSDSPSRARPRSSGSAPAGVTRAGS